MTAAATGVVSQEEIVRIDSGGRAAAEVEEVSRQENNNGSND